MHSVHGCKKSDWHVSSPKRLAVFPTNPSPSSPHQSHTSSPCTSVSHPKKPWPSPLVARAADELQCFQSLLRGRLVVLVARRRTDGGLESRSPTFAMTWEMAMACSLRGSPGGRARLILAGEEMKGRTQGQRTRRKAQKLLKSGYIKVLQVLIHLIKRPCHMLCPDLSQLHSVLQLLCLSLWRSAHTLLVSQPGCGRTGVARSSQSVAPCLPSKNLANSSAHFTHGPFQRRLPNEPNEH